LIEIIDRSGQSRNLDARAGKSLMPQLRPLRVGIIGLCNGNMACGTCHVFVVEDRFGDLPPAEEDELELLGELPTRRPNSRLSCQIIYADRLDGISLTVAPRT
jgi:ferredoxin, 2Fe-2S